MRDDQYLRLQTLEEKLTDQLLTEADPVNWTANGIVSKDLTQQQRGDRYWCKKNAVATISLAIRIGSLLGMIQRRDTGMTPPADEGEEAATHLLDQEVASAEKEAKRLLSKFERKAGQAKA